VHHLDRQAALDVLSSQHELDFAPRLRSLAGLPVEVMHGRLDPVRTILQAETFARGIGPSGARLTLVDSGHTPVFEVPAAVAAVVRRVLAAARA
jgi:pimeloyl-ACP methyl ester carboxylesterase